MEQIESPIDPTEINITFTEIEDSDLKVEFEIPQKLVKRISKKLKKGGINYNDQQMTALLVKICIDEGTVRLEKDSTWGFMHMQGTPLPEYKDGEEFAFTSVVDTYSVDDIPDLSGVKIKQLKVEVNDSLIEEEVKSQQLECGTRTPHSGPLSVGDELTVSFTLTENSTGQALLSGENIGLRVQPEGIPLVLGGYAFDELNEKLVGLTPENQVSLDTVVPPLFEHEQLRGAHATLTLNVVSVSKVTPATIEEVLEQYGMPNETILRTQIKHSLQSHFDVENEFILINQLYDQLDNVMDFEIPDRIIQSHFQEQCNHKLRAEERTELSEDEQKSMIASSQSFVKRQAITTRLRNKFDLKVGESEIDLMIRKIAGRRRERPEDVKEEYISSNRMGVLSNMCAEFNVLHALKDTITIENE